MEFGVVTRPHPGYEANGDAYSIEQRQGIVQVAVVDGLGHGPDAAEASEAAIKLLTGVDWSELTDMVRRCHHVLRGTRGAALALVRIDVSQHRLAYTGVGNIEARLIGSTTTRPISYNGIVGNILPHFKVFEFGFRPEDLLIIHSDGISARFDTKLYAGLTSQPVQLIAEAIARDWVRPHDDATLIVGRHTGEGL